MFTGGAVTAWKCPALSQGIRWTPPSQCEQVNTMNVLAKPFSMCSHTGLT